MADVRPFRAIFYRHRDGDDITPRTAPPYDVVTPEQRERLLAADPHNVVAVELAEGPLDPGAPGNRYETAAARWREWRDDGVVTKDVSNAIYVLEQRFEVDGHSVRRQAFIAALELVPFSAGIVLPHERTLPKALDDRLNLTRSCATNFSQVFCMFSDPAGETDAIFDEAKTGDPVLTAVDEAGVTSTLWAIRDAETIQELRTFFAEEQLFIADGHHRYTTALAYRDERRASSGASAALDGGYDSVMTALVNMDDPDLLVLPTHRVAKAAGEFDPEAFRGWLASRFELSVLGPEADLADALSGPDRPAFVVGTGDGFRGLAVLRPDVDVASAVASRHSTAWLELDVAVLQELVLDPYFGIHPDRPETLDRLGFVKNAEDALSLAEGYDAAFVVRPTRMDQLRAVALAGETMPQKSTYFYPKLLSGLLFRSLDD